MNRIYGKLNVVLLLIESMKQLVVLVAVVIVGLFLTLPTNAQELNAKITINHSQIQGTDASIFEELQKQLEQFV